MEPAGTDTAIHADVPAGTHNIPVVCSEVLTAEGCVSPDSRAVWAGPPRPTCVSVQFEVLAASVWRNTWKRLC